MAVFETSKWRSFVKNLRLNPFQLTRQNADDIACQVYLIKVRSGDLVVQAWLANHACTTKATDRIGYTDTDRVELV